MHIIAKTVVNKTETKFHFGVVTVLAILISVESSNSPLPK